MTDEMPLPELIDTTDRVWKPVSKYLPHKGGRVAVSRNPQVATEQVHDAFKSAKKSSGTKHLDPLIKHHMPRRIVNAAVSDLFGATTLKKGARGRRYIIKNYWADKLGWARRKIVGRLELPRVRGKRRRRRKRII